MKKFAYSALFVVFVIGSFMGGMRYHPREAAGPDEGRGGRRVLYYVDPMNPSHTSDKPGFAPCGMALEPVYADEATAGGDGAGPASPMAPGTVKITPRKQQLIGVQVGTVEKAAQTQTVRTLGRVTPDENRVYRMVAGDAGWVWDVFESTTGSLVRKDQLMGTMYNYQFLVRQQQYLYALDLADRSRSPSDQALAAAQPAAQSPGIVRADASMGAHPEESHSEAMNLAEDLPDAQSEGTPSEGEHLAQQPPAAHPEGAHSEAMHHAQQPPAAQQAPQERFEVPIDAFDMNETPSGLNPARGVYYYNNPLELAKLELYNLGVSEYQMQEIARTRQITKKLEMRSPVTGIVIARSVSPQQKFEKGGELFRVADVSRVWVMADVFAREAEHIRPGTRARVTFPGRARVFEAVVGGSPPQFDAGSRSLKVRLEADNPDLELRPDMFVDVEFLIELPEAITVPVDAVIDSGLSKTVFIALGDGLFEPRTVKTGWRFGDRLEVTEGLSPGERIVVSGNFLIDSESRMKLAAAGFHGPAGKEPAYATVKPAGEGGAHGKQDAHGKEHASHGAGEVPPPHGDPAHSMEMPAKGQGPQEPAAPQAEKPVNRGLARDPVCGMRLDGEKAAKSGLSLESAGRTYYFCSEQCKNIFRRAMKNREERLSSRGGAHGDPAHGGHAHD